MQQVMLARGGPRAVDQQGSQVGIAALAHAEQRRLAAARMLSGHQPEPRCNLAAAVEVLRISDGRN